MIKNVIFDFDGTLADTLDLALDFGNANYRRFAKTKITRDEFRERSMREVLKFLGIRWYRLPQFIFALKNHLRSNVSQVSLFSGISEFIKLAHGQGFHLYILSSNSLENIEPVLLRAELRGYFRGIVSDASIFGKHVVLRKMLKTQGLRRTESVYIGDEVRDYDACKKVGLPMVAVAWGWDSFNRLKRENGIRIVETPEELLLMGPTRGGTGESVPECRDRT